MEIPQAILGDRRDRAKAQKDLGDLLTQQDKIDEALAAYLQAIALDPSLVMAHNNLGNLLVKQGKIDDALDAYKRAINLEPENAIAHNNLGNLLAHQGKVDDALACYETAIRLRPDYDLAKFGRVMAQLPLVYTSKAEIKKSRSNYTKYLTELANNYRAADQEKLEAAAFAAGSFQPFYLPYQGLNDRQLQQTYGSMIHLLMSSLYPQWSGSLAIKKLTKSQKVRIGFVSSFFTHHSVWKIPLQGWIENLDRSEFELFGYFTGNKRDQITTRAAKLFDQFEYNCVSVEQWAEKIYADELDALIFPEFGMDSMTVKLGCLRLAPLQATAGGHPETSGLPTIDYYLSSDLMEPAHAQSHYTEKLIRLPNLAICYRHLSIKPKLVTKEELGLQTGDIMFWCCQSLFKYLPQHDDVFPRIAQQLPTAKFVFIRLESELATSVFTQRIAHSFQDFNLNYQDYCLFLPRLDAASFAGTTAIADVFLDNIGWSGENTTIESTIYNLPIVTLPGEMMRARHTMAILKVMGVEETIAQNKDHYIKIALHLGQDLEFRKQISQKIALNKDKLVGDLTPVRALEDFLLQALNRERKSLDGQINILQLARKYLQGNQLKDAQTQYLKALEIEPDHAEALYSLGIIAQKRKALDEAKQYFQASIAVQPELLKAWFSLGNLFQSQGKFSEAESSYRRALSLRTDSAPICNNLGYVLQKQGQWSAAASYYEKALELMPNCLEAEVNWKNALFAQGKLFSEEQRYYANVNFKLGLGSHQKGDWHTAGIYYRQAIAMQPDFSEAHYHLGLALQLQRKLAAALDCYQRVLQLNPDCGEAYYNLGKIYQDLGELVQATASFKLGLKLLNPNYDKALEFGDDLESFANSFTVPQVTSAEIAIAEHKFPVIPKLPERESKRPFWSVVIPVVNRPEYFPECLANVLAQWKDHEDMEIIVLDNGSEPPQWQIPETLGRGIVRYYRFPKTISLQENWNAAVSLCRGQWIHLLHHDDYILPEFYSRLRAGLETCPQSVGAAFTGYQNINEERQVVFSQDHNLKNYRGIVPNWILRIGVSCPLSPPSLVIRRAVYEELGGYKLDLPYTCDWEFYKRVATFYDWWYEPGILAHYREQANSITVAENINGSSGVAHRRAIEISASYLPAECRDAITAKSFAFHFDWCLKRAEIPLKAGNFEGVFSLVKEAFKMDNSSEAIARLHAWLDRDQIEPFKNKILNQLDGFKEVAKN